jgi:hypothetical protein
LPVNSEQWTYGGAPMSTAILRKVMFFIPLGLPIEQWLSCQSEQRKK